MNNITKETILNTLKEVVYHKTGKNLIQLGWIDDILIKNGHIVVTLDIPSNLSQELGDVRIQAEKAIHSIDGVITSKVILTSKKSVPHKENLSGSKRENKLALKGIKNIIAVASGKGGVGKSGNVGMHWASGPRALEVRMGELRLRDMIKEREVIPISLTNDQ